MHTSQMLQLSMVTEKNCPPNRVINGNCRQQKQLSSGTTGGQLTAFEVLSEEQRQYAASHHDLIYAFLHNQHWDVEEYYDIAAFGFLRAVMRYQSESHLQKYAFSTIAWRTMKQSIASYHRTECRRLCAEQKYCATDITVYPDPFEEMEIVMLLQELVSHTTPAQYQLAQLRLQGYSIAETAKVQGISPKRVSRLLKQMYEVYLQLYKE